MQYQNNQPQQPLKPLPPEGTSRPAGANPLQGIMKNPLAIAGIALVALLVLSCLCITFLGSSLTNLLGGATQPNIAQQPGQPVQPAPGNTNPSAAISRIVMARQVSATREPVQPVSSFNTNEEIIYATYQINRLQAGDKIFARWLKDGATLTDTDTITAPQEYTNRWGEFHLQPKQGASWDRGNYEVQIIVNGTVAGSAKFIIQ